MIGCKMIGLSSIGFTSKEWPVQKSCLQPDPLGFPCSLSAYSRIILRNVLTVPDDGPDQVGNLDRIHGRTVRAVKVPPLYRTSTAVLQPYRQIGFKVSTSHISGLNYSIFLSASNQFIFHLLSQCWLHVKCPSLFRNCLTHCLGEVFWKPRQPQSCIPNTQGEGQCDNIA